MDPGTHLTVVGRMNALIAEPLVDSGATGVFMHPDFAHKCKAIIRLKKVPREVKVIDGQIINSGLITHEAIFQLHFLGHTETLTTDLTNTSKYPCILGTPWLIRHDPTIRWSEKRIIFYSTYYQTNCMQQPAIGDIVGNMSQSCGEGDRCEGAPAKKELRGGSCEDTVPLEEATEPVKACCSIGSSF